MFIKVSKWFLIFAVVIQFVPFGHSHTNPPSVKEPAWNSPGTRELVRRACFDCHSNATVWPWYSYVAPMSWLVQRDVSGGRQHLNFSEWDKPQRHARDVANQVKQGEMPLWFYLPMHPAAKLSAAEKDALMDGAEKSLGPQKTSEEH
ncbi:MAG TPA: heme-binding domain-containing protein [Bryobacteraceae bacterium]|nr:heme-binding domain-containing protein [Bryobacteraceae bacterium]